MRITVSRRSEVLLGVRILYHAGMCKVHLEDGQILVFLSAVSKSMSQLFIGFYAAGVLFIPPDMAFFVLFIETKGVQGEALISLPCAYPIMFNKAAFHLPEESLTSACTILIVHVVTSDVGHNSHSTSCDAVSCSGLSRAKLHEKALFWCI